MVSKINQGFQLRVLLMGVLWPPFGSCSFFAILAVVAGISLSCPSPIFMVTYFFLMAGSLLFDSLGSHNVVPDDPLRSVRRNLLDQLDAGRMSKRGSAHLNEAALVRQMKEAQESRSQWFLCAMGDELKVISFADMAEAAFQSSDANWAPSLHAYLGTTGIVEQVDSLSVQLRHQDGQRIWWAFGALKRTANALTGKGSRRDEPILTCLPGDVLQTISDAAAAREAFESCDARWTLSLQAYLGQLGTVEQADSLSVQLRHPDGQRIWWPYGAVVAGAKESMTRTIQRSNECKQGDLVRILVDAAQVREAFARSDARFALSLQAYLGACGRVQEVDVLSVLVRHDDGQAIWWPYGVLTMSKEALTSPSKNKAGEGSVVCGEGRGRGGKALRREGALIVVPWWCGVRGVVLAAVWSGLVFAIVHMPNPVVVVAYLALVLCAVLWTDDAPSLLAIAPLSPSCGPQATGTSRGAPWVGGTATALVCLVTAVDVGLHGRFRPALLLASLYSTLYSALYLATVRAGLTPRGPRDAVSHLLGSAATLSISLAILVAGLMSGGVVLFALLVYVLAGCIRLCDSVFGETTAAGLPFSVLGPVVYAKVSEVAYASPNPVLLPMLALFLVGIGGLVHLSRTSMSGMVAGASRRPDEKGL